MNKDFTPSGAGWPPAATIGFSQKEQCAWAAGYQDGVRAAYQKPIDMVLYCPSCGTQHIDKEAHN